MNVLFDIGYPFAWLKGGVNVLILQVKDALESLGVNVQWLRYDEPELKTADVIHYWGGFPPSKMVWDTAKALGMKRVITHLGPAGGENHGAKEYAQKFIRLALIKTLGEGRLFGCVGIGVSDADAYIFQTEAECNHASFVYGWDPKRCHAMPNGVDDVFFDESIVPEQTNALFYPAYICPRKNQVAVARAAKQQKVPVAFVGVDQGGYPEYFEQFENEIDNKYVIWLGEVQDQRRFAALYRGSLGTFLASEAENLPLVFPQSIACGRPVMSSKLTSVESYFKDRIMYSPRGSEAGFPEALRKFYEFCLSGGTQDVDVFPWSDVGEKMIDIYKNILSE